MHEKIGRDITFRAIYRSNGLRADGLTVTVECVTDPNGNVIVGTENQPTVFVGKGTYKYVLDKSRVLDRGVYIAYFTTASPCDQKHVEAYWVVGLDWIEYIGSGLTSVVSSIDLDSKITVIQGDDYLIANNRAIEITDLNGNWPDFTGSTDHEFLIESYPASNPAQLVKPFTVVTPTGANKKIRIELSAAETAALSVGHWRYKCHYTDSTDHRITIVVSQIKVVGDIA